MKVKYLGHSSILIEDKDFKALVDPFLKGNPSYKEDKSDIEGITHIFITHGHGDHIGDTVEIAKANDCLIISNAEVCSILRRRNPELKFHPMHIGGVYHFDFGRVKMTPAVHGSSFTDENGIIQSAGNPGGFVIGLSGKKIYHAGDTGLTMDMKLLEREKIDIAFLPIGGNYTMDIEDAIEAARFIVSKVTIPMHYNTFPLIKADPTQFKDRLLGHIVEILEPSESYSI